MKRKVIIVAWALGLAGIAWTCSSRHDAVMPSGLLPQGLVAWEAV